MATRFTYFGFEYEVLEDKKNAVALIDASNAQGRTIIPKEVEFEGKTYVVTKIGSKPVIVEKKTKGVRETDGRKKNYWKEEPKWVTDYETFKGPFTTFYSRGEEWYKIYGTNTAITSIVLPETITELGFGAFRMCDALKDVNLPKGITKIEDRVFSGCRSLKNITLPDGIISIGKFAFIGCESLQKITIPSSVKSIDENAFTDSNRSKCGLEEINIMNDEGNIIIHPQAFTDKVKINYLGIKGIRQKSASVKDCKEKSVVKPFSVDLEKLINAVLVDGVVTDKERAILCKKVKEAGGDVDEFEMLLDARIYEAQQKAQPIAPKAEPKPALKSEQKKEAPQHVVETKSAIEGESIADAIFTALNKESKNNYQQNMTKSFIGVKIGDKPCNFFTVVPQKKATNLSIKVKQSDNWDKAINDLSKAGVKYNNGWYSISLTSTDDLLTLIPILLQAEAEFFNK